MLFAGALDKPGTVSVNGVPARVNPHTTNFTGYATVSPGTNVVQVVAADSYGNSRTNRYQIVLTNNGVAQAITYDLNGNQVSSVTSFSTNTYEWDGADRLTAINSGTNRSEFAYDGLGRRVQIVEKQNGAVVSTKKFVWVGMAISEERDSTGATVIKRFFRRGQMNGATNLYYTRDHLGNVREMTDGTGVLRARYDYDPYGRRTKLAGDLDSDFAFTGHYFHAVSGLYLAPYRAYDPTSARWLSKDPIGERGGPNLYAYLVNSPISLVDPLGLVKWGLLGKSALGFVANGAVAVGGALLAETGVGAVAAVYGAYGVGANAGNIWNALVDKEEGPTGPAQAALNLYKTGDKSYDNAGKVIDLGANLVLGNALGAEADIVNAAGLVTAAQYDSATLEFAEYLTQLYEAGTELDAAATMADVLADLILESPEYWEQLFGSESASHGFGKRSCD